MLRKLRNLGSVLLVAIAAAALPAAAQAGSFDIAASESAITGHSELQQTNAVKFLLTKTSGTKVEGLCNTASLEGRASGESLNELTLTPTFGKSAVLPTGCFWAEPFVIPQIQMNGCKFTLTGAEQVPNTVTVDIFGCTAGKQIQIKGSADCTLDIPEQNNIGHLVSKNVEGGVVTTEMTLSGIVTTQTGATCPDGNNHQAANLSITTDLLLKAFVFTGTNQVLKHGHQYFQGIEGSQVNITST
jgi:hypothetical protein